MLALVWTSLRIKHPYLTFGIDHKTSLPPFFSSRKSWHCIVGRPLCNSELTFFWSRMRIKVTFMCWVDLSFNSSIILDLFLFWKCKLQNFRDCSYFRFKIKFKDYPSFNSSQLGTWTNKCHPIHGTLFKLQNSNK